MSSTTLFNKRGRPSVVPPATTLAELRASRGLTLNAMQEATGFGAPIWSQIERGLMVPQTRHIAALSDLFGVPLESWRVRFILETEAETP